MKKNAELTLFYQDKCYSWADLEQRFSCFSVVSSSQVISVPAQKRFFTTLALLYGLTEFKIISPFGGDSADAQRQGLLPHLNAVWVDEADKTGELIIINDDLSPNNAAVKENTLALAVATSGSQAKPKMAWISRNNIVSHCYNFDKVIPTGQTSLWLNCMPMNHIAGIMILYRSWLNNASMLLHEAFDTQKIWRDLQVYPVTHISLVPRMLWKLLEHSRDAAPPEHLRYVVVGGDKLSTTLYHRALSAGWPVFISYGMTEATSTVAIGQTPDSLELLPGLEARISEAGLLMIKGPMIASAYTDPKEKIVKDHWYETSDRVTMNHQYLSIVGRNDHMIISGGKNIAPEYIEEKLSIAPFVNDLAVGTVKHPDWGHSIVALVSGNVYQLKQWVENNIEVSEQPQYYIETAQIPRNQLGKINREKLQEMILDAKLI